MNAQIVGILNITPDSFSDGGQYAQTEKAVARAAQLVADGAVIVDIGAESTHPDSSKISAQAEIGLLEPVVKGIKEQHPSIGISVDTYKPEVMRAVLAWGADMINDVTALKQAASRRALANSQVPVVLMYSRSQGAHAGKEQGGYEQIVQEILSFFRARIAECEADGISKDRIIVDPGMGFFLGANPEPSLKVLKQLERLRELGCPLYVCTSRKSFIGTLTGQSVGERGAGTLATEIWAVLHGANYIRTHDVRALQDALTMLNAIQLID